MQPCAQWQGVATWSSAEPRLRFLHLCLSLCFSFCPQKPICVQEWVIGDVYDSTTNWLCTCPKASPVGAGHLLTLATVHIWHIVCVRRLGSVGFDRQTIADHANNLASNVQGNLKRSLEAIGVVRSHHLHTPLHDC